MIQTKCFCSIFLLLLTLTACHHKKKGDTYGVVEADYVYILTEEAGRIKEISLHQGDCVPAGTTLAKLDSDELNKNLYFARLELSEQTKRVHELLVQEQKIRHNFDKACNSTQLVCDAKSLSLVSDNIRMEKALMEKKQHLVNSLQVRISKLNIHSYQSGIISDLIYGEGEYVHQGEVIAVILNPRKLKVVFYANRKKMDPLNLGDIILVRCISCKSWQQAKITHINKHPEFTPTDHYDFENSAKLTYGVEAQFTHQPKNFKPGQPLEINWIK